MVEKATGANMGHFEVVAGFNGGPVLHPVGGQGYDYSLYDYCVQLTEYDKKYHRGAYVTHKQLMRRLNDCKVLFQKTGPEPFSYYAQLIEGNPFGMPNLVGMLTAKGKRKFREVRQQYPNGSILYKEYVDGVMEPTLYLLPRLIVVPRGGV